MRRECRFRKKKKIMFICIFVKKKNPEKILNYFIYLKFSVGVEFIYLKEKNG